MGAGEFQRPAAHAFLAADRQTLFQLQQAAGAARSGCGWLGLRREGFGEGGDQGGPLAGEAFAAVLGQDLVDEGGEASAQGGGEALDLGL